MPSFVVNAFIAMCVSLNRVYIELTNSNNALFVSTEKVDRLRKKSKAIKKEVIDYVIAAINEGYIHLTSDVQEKLDEQNETISKWKKFFDETPILSISSTWEKSYWEIDKATSILDDIIFEFAKSNKTLKFIEWENTNTELMDEHETFKAIKSMNDNIVRIYNDLFSIVLNAVPTISMDELVILPHEVRKNIIDLMNEIEHQKLGETSLEPYLRNTIVSAFRDLAEIMCTQNNSTNISIH